MECLLVLATNNYTLAVLHNLEINRAAYYSDYVFTARCFVATYNTISLYYFPTCLFLSLSRESNLSFFSAIICPSVYGCNIVPSANRRYQRPTELLYLCPDLCFMNLNFRRNFQCFVQWWQYPIVYMPSFTLPTICWIHYYRLQINWVFLKKKNYNSPIRCWKNVLKWRFLAMEISVELLWLHNSGPQSSVLISSSIIKVLFIKKPTGAPLFYFI
jgi:hypothetical protein